MVTKLLRAVTKSQSGLITSGLFQFTYDDGSVVTKCVDITGYAVGSRNLTENEWDAAVGLANILNDAQLAYA